jgi:isohexenylglutaconyl-CoA hydratase
VVVALLQGAVLGGGFGMACAVDIVIADHQTKFAMPETSLGVVPAQIAPFVIARVGLSQARRLALLGERINGQEAWRLGLVHFLTQGEAEMEAKLQSVLEQINRCAPNANMATKQLLQSMDSVIHKNDMNPVLEQAADIFVKALFSAEGKEGTAAFIEKRKPSWAQK